MSTTSGSHLPTCGDGCGNWQSRSYKPLCLANWQWRDQNQIIKPSKREREHRP
jgi:hypothetical protein